MSTSVLRPNERFAAATMAIVGGAASEYAALADDSDANYVEASAVDQRVSLEFTDFTLPAGAVIRGVRGRIRQARAGAGQNHWRMIVSSGAGDEEQYFPSTTSITTLSSAMWNALGSTALSDPAMDAVRMVLEARTDGGAIYEAYVDVIYVAQPSTNVDGPSSPVEDTNMPTVAWTNTLDADGGPEAFYQVRVFSSAQYSVGAFDPTTSTAIWDSGTNVSSGQAYTVNTQLPDGDYRAYVKVAQVVNGVAHWSAWDSHPFTVDVLRPAAPSIALTAENASGRIMAGLDANAGDATTDALEVQRATPGFVENLVTEPSFENELVGWRYWFGGTDLSRETHRAYRGQGHLRMTKTATGENHAGARVAGAAPSSVPHSLTLAFRAPPGYTYHVDIRNYDSSWFVAREFIEIEPWPAWTVTTIENWTPPVGTDDMVLVITRSTANFALGELVDVDAILIAEGTTAPAYGDGDTPGWVWNGDRHASTSRYGEWVPVRTPDGGDGLLLASNATLRDYEAPNGQVVRYRARALHDYSGVYAASAWAEASGMWESAQYWVKHPNLPGLNVPVELFSYPDVNRAARTVFIQPLGATLPVGMSDTRGGETGTIAIKAATTADRDALNAILDTTDTLLLQGPASAGHPDRYVRFGDHGSVRLVDNANHHMTRETLPWTLVRRPAGAMSGAYIAPADVDDGEELVVF